MLFQMRFRTLFTLLLSLMVPVGSAPADICFNFENRYTYPSVLIRSQRWGVFVSLFQTAHPVKLRNARRLIFQIPFDVIGETLCSLFFYATVPLHSVRILA